MVEGRTSSQSQLDRFLAAVHCADPVEGETHKFYRYPARFSPEFARAAIETFSAPGDTILDPFMGGGTTAVEALLAGRRFVGSDINPLALFVADVKTTPLTKRDSFALALWATALRENINLHFANDRHHEWAHYQRNLPWRQRKLLEMALDSVATLPTRRQRRFARCTLLQTGQWALDGRLEIPTVTEFLEKHSASMTDMLGAATSMGEKVGSAFGIPPSSVTTRRRLLCRTAVGLHEDRRLPASWLPPRLVLTSPPYVGIHVLYHRWQVNGRKETPTPYWLANCLDGRGSSHYTFGDYKRQDVVEKFTDRLRESFRSIVELLDRKSLVVQLVAFSDPDAQLGPYLKALREAGLIETDVLGFDAATKRIWREVPHRKWYAEDLPAREELLLIHRKHSKRC